MARSMSAVGGHIVRDYPSSGGTAGALPLQPSLQLAALPVQPVAVGLEVGEGRAQPGVLGQRLGEGVDGDAELVPGRGSEAPCDPWSTSSARSPRTS